jgi:putative NADH-flavin reductase
MRLTVLGASGGVGRHIVRHALADGHEVTAVVRDPARLSMRHANLSVARADPLDAESLRPSVEGANAVLSGIGPAGLHDPAKPASTSARAAVEAMSTTGVKRIVVVSAGPLNRANRSGPLVVRRVLTPVLWRVFREVYTDLELMERILRDSELDWTSVRPPRLRNGPGQGRYRYWIESGPEGVVIDRADLARAMLDLLSMPETVRHAVGVSA